MNISVEVRAADYVALPIVRKIRAVSSDYVDYLFQNFPMVYLLLTLPFRWADRVPPGP